jgi:hypothetical protein
VRIERDIFRMLGNLEFLILIYDILHVYNPCQAILCFTITSRKEMNSLLKVVALHVAESHDIREC